MEGEFSIVLVARNPQRNCHRYYAINVGRDLFGHWLIVVRNGRVGSRPRETRMVCPDNAALESNLRTRLKRRLSAPRRLGCAYELRELHSSGSAELSSLLQSIPLQELIAGSAIAGPRRGRNRISHGPSPGLASGDERAQPPAAPSTAETPAQALR